MGFHAKIKKNSKYFNQRREDKAGKQIPFPVDIRPETGIFCLHGGPGKCYRFCDVTLWLDTPGDGLVCIKK